jgi:hypothetical protein
MNTGTTKFRWNLLLSMLLLLGGCSNGDKQARLEFGEQTVRDCLEVWKKGGQPADLQASENPIEFHDDDWDASAELLDYEIQQSFVDHDGSARCLVKLKVQRGSAGPVEVRCAYQIIREPKIIVGRDPMS